MLCTPPAFILSQDQTLEIIVLKHGSCRDPILLSSLALSFFYFCLSSILICKNFRDPFQAFLSLCTSLLLFNFQGSFQPPLLRRPQYYTTFLPACQYLFQKFFEFFQALPTRRGRPLARAFIYYHSHSILSRGFLKIFGFFLKM